MKNNNSTIIIMLVVIALLFMIAMNGNNQESSYEKVIKDEVQKKYKTSGTIDCTGTKSRTPECEYLLNLPVDQGGTWQP